VKCLAYTKKLTKPFVILKMNGSNLNGTAGCAFVPLVLRLRLKKYAKNSGTSTDVRIHRLNGAQNSPETSRNRSGSMILYSGLWSVATVGMVVTYFSGSTSGRRKKSSSARMSISMEVTELRPSRADSTASVTPDADQAFVRAVRILVVWVSMASVMAAGLGGRLRTRWVSWRLERWVRGMREVDPELVAGAGSESELGGVR
jgi:hypothetical protein